MEQGDIGIEYVCSGNRFRSKFAEAYTSLNSHSGLKVSSSGTDVDAIRQVEEKERNAPGTVSLETQLYGMQEGLDAGVFKDSSEETIVRSILSRNSNLEARYENDHSFRKKVSELSRRAWNALSIKEELFIHRIFSQYGLDFGNFEPVQTVPNITEKEHLIAAMCDYNLNRVLDIYGEHIPRVLAPRQLIDEDIHDVFGKSYDAHLQAAELIIKLCGRIINGEFKWK